MSYAGHGTRTQRDSFHVIATANPQDLDTVIQRWIAVADKAQADADLVKTKLASLVTAGGWTGTGADTYARSVHLEVIEPLQKIEASARAVATSLMAVQHKVEDATASAHAGLIPWDSDTAWHVEQKKLDLFDHLIGSVVDGTLFVDPVATLDHYNSAQKDAEYDIKTGSGRVVKTISAQSWAATQQQTKPMPAVYYGAVAASVHQFDVWMEYQALNTGVHEAVSKAADRVEVSLIDFLATPSTATSPTFTGRTTTTGLGSGTSAAGMPTMPGGATDDSKGYASGYTSPGQGGTVSGSSSAGVGGGSSSSSWMPAGTMAATGEGFSGVGGYTTVSSGGAAGGNFSSVGAGSGGLSFGGATTPVGTSAAGGGAGMPGVMPAGFGGVGAPSQKGGKGNSLKVSGMSGTGSGIAGLGGNPSFRMGSMGRGTAGTGAVGGVESNIPLTSLMGGQALMGGRNVRKKDDSSEELGETWLEEDQGVWGTSGSRIDGVSF
jgi:hypothetical protein